MFLEDLKIKHLAAFVGNEIGKSVSILSISIDPEVYYLPHEDGTPMDGTDYQIATVTVLERFKGDKYSVTIEWDIEDEEITTYKINK